MIYSIPLDAVPNQSVTTTLNGETWDISLSTKRDRLYISLSNRTQGRVIENRVCLNLQPITGGFVFVDTLENRDPTFDGLNGRYVLCWSDEL